MIELILHGDEEMVIDKFDNYKLKEIRGIHLTDKNGNKILADIIFYNAHLKDDGSIDANYVFKNGERKLFDIKTK